MIDFIKSTITWLFLQFVRAILLSASRHLFAAETLRQAGPLNVYHFFYSGDPWAFFLCWGHVGLWLSYRRRAGSSTGLIKQQPSPNINCKFTQEYNCWSHVCQVRKMALCHVSEGAQEDTFA
jgi:hypothetical protein